VNESIPDHVVLPAITRVLLGEDDIDDQEFLEEIVSGLDKSYQIIAIGNGKKLITYLQNADDHQLPALLILDYNLPELNGAEILRILNANERFKSIPKIIWSTSNSTAYKAICLELGAVDYIVKPSNITSLVEVAKYMLSFCNKN
jgi:CheY-like chemotaxis protein